MSAALADRVIVLSSQPARIVAEIRIDHPRPCRADDSELHARAESIQLGVRSRAA